MCPLQVLGVLSPVPLHCLLFTCTAPVSHSLSQGVKDSQLLPSTVLAHGHVALGRRRGSIPRQRGHSSGGGCHSITFWGEILTILVFVQDSLIAFPQGEAFPSNSALN